jgi:hypothetical protein
VVVAIAFTTVFVVLTLIVTAVYGIAGLAGIVLVCGLIVLVVVVFMRGLNHHTVLSVPRQQIRPAPPQQWRPSLPDPMNNWHDASRDRPFAGTSYWADDPEPEVIVAVPEPAPDPDATVCEGPSCSVIVAPVNAWVCGSAEDDEEAQEDHYFCSKECMNGWMKADRAQRLARTARRWR